MFVTNGYHAERVNEMNVDPLLLFNDNVVAVF